MLLDFACSCGCKLQVADDQVGALVTCPECGRQVTVPTLQTSPAAPPAITATRPREFPDESDDDRPRRFVRTPKAGVSSAAITALVLGAASIFLNLLTAVPALILAIIALSNNRRRGGLNTGLAIAALIVACLGTAVSGFVVYRAYRSVADARDRIKVGNSLHQMTLAMINEADDNQGQMLAPAICSKDGKPLLSWRVALLPYLEERALYNEFHLDEPWDSPHNIQLLSRMPKVYSHPRDANGAKQGYTCFRVLTGPDTAFPDPVPPFERHRSACRFPASFTDGASRSILVVEAAETVPWTKPDELPYDPRQPLPKLGGWSRRGYMVGLADGSTRFITPDISEQTMRAAITIAGNDLLGPDW